MNDHTSLAYHLSIWVPVSVPPFSRAGWGTHVRLLTNNCINDKKRPCWSSEAAWGGPISAYYIWHFYYNKYPFVRMKYVNLDNNLSRPQFLYLQSEWVGLDDFQTIYELSDVLRAHGFQAWTIGNDGLPHISSLYHSPLQFWPWSCIICLLEHQINWSEQFSLLEYFG